MNVMLDHEKLDVYQVALEFCVWTYGAVSGLKGDYFDARNQIIRAAHSIVLNLAEGCGRISGAERRHFFYISRGSSFESAAVLDILHRMNQLSTEPRDQGKALLVRISAMLTKLARNQR